MNHVRLWFLLKGQLMFEVFFKHIICFLTFKVEQSQLVWSEQHAKLVNINDHY